MDSVGDVASRDRRRRPAPHRLRPRLRRRRLGAGRGARATGAATPGVRRQRRAADLPHPLRARAGRGGGPPLGRARRPLLPGRRVARRRLPRRPRGLLLPARLRDHRAGPPRHRARAGRRGDLRAARRQHQEARHDRRLPALRLRSTRAGTRAACGGRCGSSAAARCASAACACCAPRPTPSRAQLRRCGPSSTATPPAPSASARSSTTGSSASASSRWPRAPTSVEWTLRRRQPGPVVAVGARRPAAVDGDGQRCYVDDEVSDARTVRTGLPPGGARATGCCAVNGERMFVKGANLEPRPARPWPRPRPTSSRRDVLAGPRRRPRPRAPPRPT